MPSFHQNWRRTGILWREFGDKVVIRSTWSGTQQGPYLLASATGKPFAVQHIHIFRLVDGKVAEHWAVRDDLGMLQILGAIPAPGQAR